MAKALKFGILGCGKIAHADHVPGLQATKGVDIAALCDIVPKQMEILSSAFGLGAERFTDQKAFLASGLDAVVVCTPNSLHLPQTLAALKAGLHVLCEKPMAANSVQATRMIEAARKEDRVLHINQTLRYIPRIIAMAEAARKGLIGRIVHVRCLRAGGSSPDVGWSPGATWFVQKAFDGGIVLDIGVHMAEAMRWAAGPVTEIAAITNTRVKKIDVPDNASAMMRFASGATGVLELSWTIPCGGNLFEIYGEKGTLRMGFSDDTPVEHIVPDKGASALKIPATPPNSQQAFVRAIKGVAPSPTPGELGREAIALCEAILKSGDSGKFVKVKQF
jgi:UDP-N-acetylglucosamine 3-dehydrogenase